MPETAVTGAHADVKIRQPAQRLRPSLRHRRWAVLAAVSAGGVLGTLVRHGLTEALPHRPGSFGLATFAINCSGCLLIGVLMVLNDELWAGRRLLRPFLGVGVLGGYTTFSAYVLETQQAVASGAAGTALSYLAVTMLAALASVWAGAAVTGWAVRRRTRSRDRKED